MIKVTCPVRIDISAGWSDANPFRGEFGGAVLNAAIDWRISATLNNKNLISSLEKVPANSGLGTSGALRTAYLVAANPSLILNKIDLIKRVNVFENAIVGQRAGFQDQAAATYGGVNYWEFWKDGSIRRREIPKNKTKHLLNRLVLVFTGDRHQSSNVHEEVFRKKNYMKHIMTIERMKEIAREMVSKLRNEDKMAELIRETWMLQKALHNKMESPTMTRLQKLTKGSCLAARATGAGGGGCMIFYTDQKRKLLSILSKYSKKNAKMKIMPFKFDFKGISLKK